MAEPDALLTLKRAIAADSLPVPSSSSDPNSASDALSDLSIATHLHFTNPVHATIALSTQTRFISTSQAEPINLRSIYFAWQNKDVAIPEYIASAQALNDALAREGGAGGKVHNLVFVERLDLITWLEGASEESEYITPLESPLEAQDGETTAQAAGSASAVASGARGGIATVPSAGAGGIRPGKSIDPRLLEIYRKERRMGDRNTILRGIKPTVCLEQDAGADGLKLL